MPTSTLPSPRPTFFIDRDLGRHAFPRGLRQAGLSVVTLAEHYGIPQDQEISDHEWILEAAQQGWPVLGCDSQHRRRRRPAERAALIDAGVQNFILNGSITAAENVERVLHNLTAILAACDTPGPFVYRVHPHHIERLLNPAAAAAIAEDYDTLMHAYHKARVREPAVVVSVMSQRRYHPAFQRMRDLIAEVATETNCPVTSIMRAKLSFWGSSC